MALGFYLAVTKELGDTPTYNGSLEKYHSVEALSSATMYVKSNPLPQAPSLTKLGMPISRNGAP
jgi:hypothetical protein